MDLSEATDAKFKKWELHWEPFIADFEGFIIVQDQANQSLRVSHGNKRAW